MNADAIRGRLANLVEAGSKLRRRPASQTLDTLARVFDRFADEDSRERRALLAELPAATGFSAPVVAEGLRLGLQSWTGDRFRELVASEIESEDAALGTATRVVSGFESTAVFLAGSIPMPTLLAVVAPLALRSPVLAKVASRDPVTAPQVARAIAEADPELGLCVHCAEFPGDDSDRVDALLGAACVVAAGSDATVSAIAARARPTSRVVRYGHRLSVAVVGTASLRDGGLPGAADRLALDIALWDQLGCLSPVAVYVIDPQPAGADRFAEELARALAETEDRLPRGAVASSAAALIAHERADAEIRAAAGARVALHCARGTQWTVVREDSAAIRATPLHRFMRVVPVDDAAALLDALTPLGPHLAAVGVEGVAVEDSPLASALANLGASRICPLGSMQCPPLAWRHDNRGVLTPLARFTDIEHGG